MRLLRKLEQTKLWVSYLEAAEKTPEATPAFVIQELFDRKLSVYAAVDDATAEEIAGALTMHAGVSPGKVTFSVAQSEALHQAGLKVRKTLGETGVPAVDDLHYEVTVEHQADLTAVVKAFSVETLFIDKDEVVAAMAAIANSNTLKYAAINRAPSGSGLHRLWKSVAGLAALGKTELRAPKTAEAQ